MLELSITLVVIAHIVVSLFLILVILMQRPKQEGLGAAFGSGMTDAAWGARTTDVLQKGTVYLGTLFFVFSLVLAILMGKKNSIDGKNYGSDGGSTAKPTAVAPAVADVAAVPTPEAAPEATPQTALDEMVETIELEATEATEAAQAEEVVTPAEEATPTEEEAAPAPAEEETPANQ